MGRPYICTYVGTYVNVKTSRKMARADDRHQPPFCRRVAKPCKFLTMFMTHTKTIVNHRHANFFFTGTTPVFAQRWFMHQTLVRLTRDYNQQPSLPRPWVWKENRSTGLNGNGQGSRKLTRWPGLESRPVLVAVLLWCKTPNSMRCRARAKAAMNEVCFWMMGSLRWAS